MIQLQDICSLTDFQRHVKAHIARLKKTGRPEVLSVNGMAELVVQDTRSYQRLLDALDRAEALEGIRRGLESMKRGQGRPAEKVFEEMRKKYHIPRDL